MGKYLFHLRSISVGFRVFPNLLLCRYCFIFLRRCFIRTILRCFIFLELEFYERIEGVRNCIRGGVGSHAFFFVFASACDTRLSLFFDETTRFFEIEPLRVPICQTKFNQKYKKHLIHFGNKQQAYGFEKVGIV